MSRFYGSMQGSRGEATRQGTASSGISAHPRGWDLGVRVSGYDDHGTDAFAVNITGGSNGSREEVNVLTVETMQDGFIQIAFGLDGFEHYYTLGPNGTVVEHHPLRRS